MRKETLQKNHAMRLTATKFIAELPPGFDARTHLMPMDDGRVLAVHPEMEPHVTTPDGMVPLMLDLSRVPKEWK